MTRRIEAHPYLEEIVFQQDWTQRVCKWLLALPSQHEHIIKVVILNFPALKRISFIEDIRWEKRDTKTGVHWRPVIPLRFRDRLKANLRANSVRFILDFEGAIEGIFEGEEVPKVLEVSFANSKI